VCFAVIDSGVPILPKVASKLMTPFFTTKEPGRGTGLGLSLSKSLAERMGGSLYHVSTSANTTFELRVPRAGAAT